MRSGHTSSNAITTLPATSYTNTHTHSMCKITLEMMIICQDWLEMILPLTVVLSASSFSMTSISWSFCSGSRLNEGERKWPSAAWIRFTLIEFWTFKAVKLQANNAFSYNTRKLNIQLLIAIGQLHLCGQIVLSSPISFHAFLHKKSFQSK